MSSGILERESDRLGGPSTYFKMATFSIKNETLVISAGNSIICKKFGKSDVQILDCEKPIQKERKEEPGENEEPQGNENDSGKILSCGLSPSGKYLVACDDYKQIWIWTRDSNQWKLYSKRDLGRRSTSLAFPQDEKNVVIADKSGDVFSFSLTDVHSDGQLILGHVSMLLDVAFCGKDDNFLVTCDRDEKVRVSHYPNAYNVQSYCLGHTDFVSRLAYFKEEDLLVSGGGDSTLRIWNYKSGKELFILNLEEDNDIKCQSEYRGQQSDLNDPGNLDNKTMQTAEDDSTGSDDMTKTAKASEVKEAIMSRTKGLADVKCMVCCQKNKYLAVGLDKLSVLILYKLDTSIEGKPQLVKRQKLDLNGHHVLDISFDQWDNLWYLEATQGNIAHIMSYHQSKDLYVPLEESDELEAETKHHLLSFAGDINTQHQDMFKGSFDDENSFELLHKVKIDNISSYLERKHQRIEQKVQKRKGKVGNNTEEEKKLKNTEKTP